MYGLIEREDEPFIVTEPENWDHTEVMSVDGDFKLIASWDGDAIGQEATTRMLNEMTQVMDRYRGLR